VLPASLQASQLDVKARIETIVLNPNQVTTLHLRPEFESAIRMPEEVTSVVLGSPSLFKAEHSEGEPEYVYVKPITKELAKSNLLIATKSGRHVTLELISQPLAGTGDAPPVDFLLEYRGARSFLVDMVHEATPASTDASFLPRATDFAPRQGESSALEQEYEQQRKINAPVWTKWPGKLIETSLGDIRQIHTQVAVSYSVLNNSSEPVEILPPQVQIEGRRMKKKKEGKQITSDQLQIREYRLSATRLEPGERADGVVVYDRPNFKQSSEKLFLQIAQADQVDRPVLVRLPFTPQLVSYSH
jgi:hypothetical protein